MEKEKENENEDEILDFKMVSVVSYTALLAKVLRWAAAKIPSIQRKF